MMMNYTKMLLLPAVLLLLAGCGTMTERGADALVDNGDGTIINNLEGQMWAQKKTNRFSSGEEAQRYADTAVLGGYDDWRLPTLAEFEGLYYAIDFGQGSVQKTGIAPEGDIWVVRDQEVVSGAWEKENSCLSREYTETGAGRVWLVRP